ncbi:hypothetical protein [Morganella morganii]|uniref:hypothetical protein n=1 Tax=Morganella morganii TaxID=582 RepID=UPI001C459066|nr:hypothetical protein [Morganella morganii]
MKPFAKNGQKNVIPENYETSMESNQATWDQGFGQITMLPVAAGGLPPKGQDFNGIFNQISENIVYLSQGGRFKFSAEYAEAIGGYPKGAILQSDDEKKDYLSLIDNNKVDFNTASDISASWKLVNTDDLLAQIASKQPKGDYATKTELNSGLAGKQPTGDYATKTEVNSKLAKDQNGADIPNKPKFIENLGLGELTKRFVILNSAESQVRSGNGKRFIYVNDDGRFGVAGETGSGWGVNKDGVMNGVMVPVACGGTGGKTAGEAIKNLGIDLMTVPVGASVIWNSSAAIPDNFWPNEGRSFSASEYPELAKVFPDLKLPDDRGMYIRIADNGKGIDKNRTVGTFQDYQMKDAVGYINGRSANADITGAFVSGDGVFSLSAKGGSLYKDVVIGTNDRAADYIKFDLSRVMPTGDQINVKNTSKILITRIK